MSANERAPVSIPQTKSKKRKIFKKFCESTSLHGYSYLYIANSTVMKSIWTLVIIGMSGVGISFLVINTNAFVRSRLVTNIESSTADLSVSIFKWSREAAVLENIILESRYSDAMTSVYISNQIFSF